MSEIDATLLKKLEENFAGRFVRKDLTARIKEGANVPTYVLEYLLGMFANSTDEDVIEQGVQRVRATLANNYVRPDEAEKVKAKIRERGSYTVIDKVTVHLNTRKDRYEASFSNLGLKEVITDSKYPEDYERLLSGGIWCIVRLSYFFEENSDDSPFILEKLDPIQIAGLDMQEIYNGRKNFTTEEWMALILRTIGLEPQQFSEREQLLLILRLVPFVENNYNLVELGPRGTGKSHGYKELSPNSILVSGGQTTVANLFYNMGRRQVGLVGMWDLVAFDEVAGINFKDKDGVQIMKDYMASGSFARGKDEIQARASMVFVGNINQSVDVILKSSNLFEPFPDAMANDSAFFDRIHAYLPGWEIPKYKPAFFAKDYGFITDYFAEVMRELRKQSYSDAFDKYFNLGEQLNQRDTIAVRKTVSGMIKLLYPDGNFTKDEVEKILAFALEMRRRVKEQLKKIGGMEFFDVELSYKDKSSLTETVVPVPEQSSNTLIPNGRPKAGQIYTVALDNKGRRCAFSIESQMTGGRGKFDKTGISGHNDAKEAMENAYRYLKKNSGEINTNLHLEQKDFVVNVANMNNLAMTKELTIPTYIALVSIALNRPALESLVVLGDFTLNGSVKKVDSLADTIQVAYDSGAKQILLPSQSLSELANIPEDMKNQLTFIPFDSVETAAVRALGFK